MDKVSWPEVNAVVAAIRDKWPNATTIIVRQEYEGACCSWMRYGDNRQYVDYEQEEAEPGCWRALAVENGSHNVKCDASGGTLADLLEAVKGS